jgi:hypothetical protein
MGEWADHGVGIWPHGEADDAEKLRQIAGRGAMKVAMDGRHEVTHWPAAAFQNGLMKVRGLFRPNALGEPSKASRRLCIVSRDRHLSGEFVASFTTALGAREKFEIIVDRRRDGPPSDPPSADRRSRPDVTRALERDGFAVVSQFETRPVQDEQLQLFEVSGASPIERVGLEAADARQLERILGFKRRARLRQRWILTGLIAVLVALPVLSLAGRTLVSRTHPVEPPPIDGMGASPLVEKSPQAVEAQAPRPGLAVAETPSPSLEVHASQRAESPAPWGSRAPDSLRRSVPEPSVDAPTMSGPTPSASSPSQTGAVSRDSSLNVGPPQVDVTRDPAPASNGGGEAFAVRLADSGGRPLAGAEVFLRIRTADGTTLDLALGAGANPGTYSITTPPLRSAPVDVRLRVVTNNTRVEIPLMP